MNRIEHKILYFTEGNSDKIYEADICEISEGKYLVNFRFGRRGGILKEGSKTTSPVSLDEARKLFNELISSKTKKGYQEVSSIPDTEIKPIQKVKVPEIEDNDPVKLAVLKRLTQKKGKWKLSRAIWRAGELRIKEAAPLLLGVLETTDELQKYCTIWSLGFCGDENTIEILSEIYNNNKNSEMTRRISCEALLKLSDAETKEYFSEDMIEKLPSELKLPVKTKNITLLKEVFENYLKTNRKEVFETIETFYLIDNEITRPLLIDYLKTAPLKPGHFKRLRHIFKAAEYRFDGEVFGILAYRFEKEKEMFNNKGYGFNSDWGYIHVNNTYMYAKEAKQNIKSDNATIAYGTKTRDYFKKRVYRSLKTLGEDNKNEYVNMAVGVLLQYSDNDASNVDKTVKSYYDYKNRTYVTTEKYWPKYGGYMTFSYILYGNSTRMEKADGARAWSYKGNPGSINVAKREEAFPELWNKNPSGLIYLLAESRCHEVNIFAVKALRELKNIWSDIDLETLILFLKSNYQETSELAFEIAKGRYNPDDPDIDLIKALICCNFEPARKQSIEWVLHRPDYFAQNSDFIFSLINCNYSDIRLFVINLLKNRLSEEKEKTIVARVISEMMTISDNEKARDITDILMQLFSKYLININTDVISDLLDSKLSGVQELGAKITVNHELSPNNIPQSILDKIINSEYQNVREYGIKVLSQLSDDSLLTKYDLLVSFISYPLQDLRELIKPVIKRLSNYNEDFAKNIVLSLADRLTHKENYEGLHQDINNILVEYLSDKLHFIHLEEVLKLVNSRYVYAQDLGGEILRRPENIKWSEEIGVINIVKLANHELLNIREASWNMLIYLNEKIRKDPDTLVKVMRFFDSKKEDSRMFARNKFSKLFADSDWTPELLIGLSDSIYDDVRKFGRDLIMTYFKSDQGQEYLTKLSEHPATDIQLFATSYLEEYASGNPEKMEELKPYFKRVLAQVNKSRIAKDRILIFLQKEAEKSEKLSEIVTEILSWYSATVAISDKAKSIEILLKIKQKYPEIKTPLKIKEAEVRNGI